MSTKKVERDLRKYKGLQSRGEFAGAWDELYLGNGFGWAKNPWVWVIKFERVEI